MSMIRTIKSNIARENMARAGVKHSHRKGYAADPKNKIKISKAYKRTLTSLFALNWRLFLPSTAKPRKRDSRKKVIRCYPLQAVSQSGLLVRVQSKQ